MLRKSIYKIGYLIRLGLKYSTLSREYKILKKQEFETIDENLSLQKDRLYRLITHAITNVPYYKQIVESKEISIKRETILEDIKGFPILTKEIIRENWNDLHVDLEKIDYKIETSGGTTGEPIRIIHDWDYRVKNQAGTRYLDEIGKYTIGDKLVRLWGSEAEIIKATSGKINHFINKYIKNTCFQNSFKMSDEDILNFVNQINKIKPKTIIAYVQSIHEMAKFIEKENLGIHSPQSIIVSAGVLQDDVKAFLEGIFNCKVFNRYGSRELGNIAVSCESENKLHINMLSKYVEVLNDNGQSLAENEKGNIIITSLTNYNMPLIRYKIGDIGSLNFEQCKCGRGSIRLNNIFGRTVDIFKNSKNEKIDGEFFTHLFYLRDNIKQFQVIQESVNLININIVTLDGNELNSSSLIDIEQKIKIVMGNNCKINFDYKKIIEPSGSGKMRYTISKLEDN